MKTAYLIAASCLLLAACSTITGNVVEETSMDEDLSEMGTAFVNTSTLLFIEPENAEKEREEFIVLLKNAAKKDRRALYDQHISTLGANGILDAIEHIWPKCHSEAHDLGKVIFSKLQDIGLSLRVCADRCYSGCMHGILMEAFRAAQNHDDPDHHVDPGLLKPLMNDLCSANKVMTAAYSPGDCAHGVGHALMFLTGYTVPHAIEACESFDSKPLQYYCATGAYMEYVTENDAQDAKTKPWFSPCDTNKYPAACARYKMVHVIKRHYQAKKPTGALIKDCEALAGAYRLGCFHGLGNAHMALIATGKRKLNDVCTGSDDEQRVCIEGAMERMSKYHPALAKNVCATVHGKQHEVCTAAVGYGMYNIGKDLSLYLSAQQNNKV